MDIVTFARLNGILIDRLIEDGKWHRCPTEAHPKKRNGAYMSRGLYGFVQDHANHTEPIPWKPEDNEIKPADRAAIEARVRAAADEIRAGQQKAAERARKMLEASHVGPHPYLTSKGFPEAVGHLLRDEKASDLKLLIPMSVAGQVVGLQTISDQPGHEKRFLYGQRTSETTLVRGKPALNAVPVHCEGFATALSIERALRAGVRGISAYIVVCFTAGNLLKIAKAAGRGIVVADYDEPSKMHPDPGGHGIAVAKEIGLPFWQSDREGEDFNDYEQRVHTFKAGMALKPFFMKARG